MLGMIKIVDDFVDSDINGGLYRLNISYKTVALELVNT